MQKNYISLKAAAGMLEVTPQTVRFWARDKKIKSMQTLGGNYRILRDDVIRIIEERQK